MPLVIFRGLNSDLGQRDRIPGEYWDKSKAEQEGEEPNSVGEGEEPNSFGEVEDCIQAIFDSKISSEGVSEKAAGIHHRGKERNRKEHEGSKEEDELDGGESREWAKWVRGVRWAKEKSELMIGLN